MKSNQAGYIPGLREYRMIFCKADYVESGEALGNPDCGWYRIYPFVFKEVSGAVFPALDFRPEAWKRTVERDWRWYSSISVFSGIENYQL